MISGAKRPMIIAGGGVQYSKATVELRAFAEEHNIPVVETIAGRANLTNDDPLNMGPIGVTGSTAPILLRKKRMLSWQWEHACRILPPVHGLHLPRMLKSSD